MNVEEMKAAITAADAVLDEALSKTKYASEGLEVKSGWKAWEWCRQQLVTQGLSEDEALQMQKVFMQKARTRGTYQAIHACVFGEPGTATVLVG